MNNFIRNTFLTLFILCSFSLPASEAKNIFDRYCTVCHSPSMAPMFGSPAAHDLDAWNERKDDAFLRAIERDSSLKGLTGGAKDEVAIKSLVLSAIDGTDKGMPPMGTCMDCTEDQLTATIKFMSSPE